MTFFLHQGSKSDKTHTIINIHPLAYLLDICASIFSSCVFFYSLSQRHPTPRQVITARVREFVRKNTGPNNNGRVKLIQLTWHIRHMLKSQFHQEIKNKHANPDHIL